MMHVKVIHRVKNLVISDVRCWLCCDSYGGSESDETSTEWVNTGAQEEIAHEVNIRWLSQEDGRWTATAWC